MTDEREPPSISLADLENQLGDSVYHDGWKERLTTTKSGAIASNLFNIQLILQFDPAWKGVLAYCEFSYRIIKLKAPPFAQGQTGEWEDVDTARFRIWLTSLYEFSASTNDADDAILVEAKAHKYHPVKDYLRSIKWDGKHRLETWLTTYLGVKETTYTNAVGTLFMISAIARVMQPPVKVDSVLILEGLQGKGKSTALAVLFGEFFSDTPFDLGDKDGYQQMQGLWCVEFAELDSFNKAESTKAKTFFGSKSDRFRPSYGRRAMDFPRQCVFVGTTNQKSYLKDATGNRRYWPVTCTCIDLKALKRDRDQLWAEACVLWGVGDRWWPSDKDSHLFEHEQETRYTADEWEGLIIAWLEDVQRRCDDYFTGAQIMEGALKLLPQHMRPPDQMRVGSIMVNRLGWGKAKRTIVSGAGEKGRQWAYLRPKERPT